MKYTLDTYPFQDDTMLWVADERMYILNPLYVTKKAFNTSNAWGSDENVLLELTRIGRNFKDYLINMSAKAQDLHKTKREILEYQYAKDHTIRDVYAQGMLRFAILDDKTDGGTDAEYFGDVSIVPKNIYMYLVSNALIKKGSLRYRLETTDNDFALGVDRYGA